MPALTGLVVDAPASGYLAALFLTLIETSKHPALLPFMANAVTAWCGAYGADTNYWTEHNFGTRICSWHTAVLAEGSFAPEAVIDSLEKLITCLDILVRSGIAQAHDVEEQIRKLTERT